MDHKTNKSLTKTMKTMKSKGNLIPKTTLKHVHDDQVIHKSSRSSSSNSSKILSLHSTFEAPKFEPANCVVSYSIKNDCCAFIIHCPVHNTILINNQKNVVWMPFTSLIPNLGWEDNALIGFLIVVSGGDREKYESLKKNGPYEYFKCLQVLRLQLPRTLKFVTRLIYYFKIRTDVDNFQCCQQYSQNFEWRPLAIVQKPNSIPNLWGPELSEFSVHWNRETEIQEYSLEEAFLYVPRDPSRNPEEEMLKTIKITEKDVERLYKDFLDHCFPSFYMSIESFKFYMKKHGFEKNNLRIEKFFRAFNYTKSHYLTFHEFLLGLASMESTIQHGKFRVKFIFRFYSDNLTYLNKEQLKEILFEMDPDVNTLEERLQNALKTFNAKKIDGQMVIMEREFVSAIGTHRFRGTSVLCRYKKGIFNEINRAAAGKGLTKTKQTLSNVMIKRQYKGICEPCRQKKYGLAAHSVSFNEFGNLRSKRLRFKEKEENPSTQYSIETVFNQNSAANIIINLIRDFGKEKGTVCRPKGLMQGRKEDLWKLLLSIYTDLDVLLKNEQKCHKTYSPCYIMGDIHGNIEDLFSLEKALWKQIPCVGANYLFLGDYVDRGQWGFECALYLFAFKILCPNKVTLLRGNHEVRLLQSHYTYKRECIMKYGDLFGLKIWELTNRIFDRLPVCALVDDSIFCAHGGLPRSATQIEQLTRIKQELKDPERESAAAWEILWSDPCHMQQFLEIADLLNLDPKRLNGFIKNTKRGTAFLFNEVGVNNFLEKNGLTHIIRAHEVPKLGYTFHFGNKCATIFSCSHYCGNENESACILVDTQKLRVIHLDTTNNASATD